jgi:hypothetical protein
VQLKVLIVPAVQNVPIVSSAQSYDIPRTVRVVLIHRRRRQSDFVDRLSMTDREE